LGLILSLFFVEKQQVEYSLGTDKKNKPIATEVTGPNGAQLVRPPPQASKAPAPGTKVEEPVPPKK
jgi:hypothetical protein